MSKWELEFEDRFEGPGLDRGTWLPYYLPQWSSRGQAAARGQHRFTPREVRMRALDDPRCMCALWLIGFEDEPDRSAETCVCEIFGSDVGPADAKVGMGVHAFRDPGVEEAFAVEELANLYEFPGDGQTGPYPKVFHVDYVRGYHHA